MIKDKLLWCKHVKAQKKPFHYFPLQRQLRYLKKKKEIGKTPIIIKSREKLNWSPNYAITSQFNSAFPNKHNSKWVELLDTNGSELEPICATIG